MDFLYYPDPEWNIPIDDPETQVDWASVDLSPRACVARGIAWLQEKYPQAMLRLDVEALDIADCTMCVLGQLFGDYQDSTEYLVYGSDWLIAHGFTAAAVGTPNAWSAFEALSEQWRRQLSAPGVLS